MSLRAAGVDGLARVRPSTPLVRSLVVLLAALSLAGPQSARADEAANVLKKMNALYAHARSYEGTVTIHNSGKSPRDGKAYTAKTVKHVRYKSPNLIQMTISMSGTGALASMAQDGVIVSDGHTVYQYSPKQKQYRKQTAPPNLPLAQALNVPNITSATLKVVGSTTVNGHSAYEIEVRFKMPNLPANIPPQQKAQIQKQVAAPVRLVIDKQNGALLHLSAQTIMGPTSVDYSSQAFDVPLPASDFTFKPPAGAKEMVAPPGPPGAPGAPGLPPGGRRP